MGIPSPEGTGSAANAAKVKHDAGHKLSENSRVLWAMSRAREEEEAVLVIASSPGNNSQLVKEVSRIGGAVMFRDDDVDYLRVRLPLANVLSIAASPFVESLDLDREFRDFSPGESTQARKNDASLPSTDADTPFSQPYLPSEDIDADALVAANPTFDGRGVGIAIVDGTPDFLLPEFQKAMSLDGRDIPKMADIVSVTDPVNDNDPMWVRMKTTVHTESGTFSYDVSSYTAPTDGTFLLGFFDERALKISRLDKDINFDGNPEGSSGLFAVLWNKEDRIAWVDTNQDLSFADEKPLREYAASGDFGIFGRDKPETEPRESIGFTVQFAPAQDFIRLNLGVYLHGSMLGASAAGKALNHSAFNGVAPGAQLISIHHGDAQRHVIEGAILAARNPKVDVICVAPWAPVTSLAHLRDGRLTLSVILDRIVDRYSKPILRTAGNTVFVKGIHDLGAKVMAVGAYQSAEAYRVNYGALVENRDNLHWLAGYGPTGSGALKPDFISPSGIITAGLGFNPSERRKGVYQLPPGYWIGSGTSQATPVAAGALALLISAAKQSGVRWDAERLRFAVMATTRFLPNFGAHQQGNGLIQVHAAWELLKSMNSEWSPVAIECRGPVKTADSHLLRSPHEGVGIFERENWLPGQTGARVLTCIRTSGSSDPMTFDVSWAGNSRGVFQSAESLTLPLDTPVSLPVVISVPEAGVYSAILNLRQPKHFGNVHQVLGTVIVAESLSAANDFSASRLASLPRPGTDSLFFKIGAEASTFGVEVDNFNPVSTSLTLGPPAGSESVWYPSESVKNRRMPYVVVDPLPGVWEVNLWNNRFAHYTEVDPEALQELDSRPLAPIPVTIKVSAYDFSATPHTLPKDSVTERATVRQTISLTNRLAAFFGGASSSALASVRTEAGALTAGERKMFELDIPPGTISLAVSVRADLTADIELYLFEVTKAGTMLRGQANDLSDKQTIVVDKPAAGRWRVIVNSSDSARGEVRYRYSDWFSHPVFGKLTVSDLPKQHLRGQTWSVEADYEIEAVPRNGRFVGGILTITQPTSPDASHAPDLSSGDVSNGEWAVLWRELIELR